MGYIYQIACASLSLPLDSYQGEVTEMIQAHNTGNPIYMMFRKNDGEEIWETLGMYWVIP